MQDHEGKPLVLYRWFAIEGEMLTAHAFAVDGATGNVVARAPLTYCGHRYTPRRPWSRMTERETASMAACEQCCREITREEDVARASRTPHVLADHDRVHRARLRLVN